MITAATGIVCLVMGIGLGIAIAYITVPDEEETDESDDS